MSGFSSSVSPSCLASITLTRDEQLLASKRPPTGLGRLVLFGPTSDCQQQFIRLTSADSTARALVIELDTRGLDGAQTALDAAAACGLIGACIAFKGSEGYDRSQIWICYQQAYELARLQAQGVGLLAYAGLPGAVLYPTNQFLCPPLGLYRSPGVQGRLFSPTGHSFDIGNEAQRSLGILIVEALPFTTTPPPSVGAMGEHHVTTCSWMTTRCSGCSQERDSVSSARYLCAVGYGMLSGRGQRR